MDDVKNEKKYEPIANQFQMCLFIGIVRNYKHSVLDSKLTFV